MKKRILTLSHEGERHAWRITQDAGGHGHLHGLMGPEGCDITAEEITATGRAFRLIGPCGVVRFEGVYAGPDDTTVFAPLDEFGTDYGCEFIEYRNALGSWEPL